MNCHGECITGMTNKEWQICLSCGARYRSWHIPKKGLLNWINWYILKMRDY
jgi:hypothetical protein